MPVFSTSSFHFYFKFGLCLVAFWWWYPPNFYVLALAWLVESNALFVGRSAFLLPVIGESLETLLAFVSIRIEEKSFESIRKYNLERKWLRKWCYTEFKQCAWFSSLQIVPDLPLLITNRFSRNQKNGAINNLFLPWKSEKKQKWRLLPYSVWLLVQDIEDHFVGSR